MAWSDEDSRIYSRNAPHSLLRHSARPPGHHPLHPTPLSLSFLFLPLGLTRRPSSMPLTPSPCTLFLPARANVPNCTYYCTSNSSTNLASSRIKCKRIYNVIVKMFVFLVKSKYLPHAEVAVAASTHLTLNLPWPVASTQLN